MGREADHSGLQAAALGARPGPRSPLPEDCGGLGAPAQSAQVPGSEAARVTVTGELARPGLRFGATVTVTAARHNGAGVGLGH